MKSDMQLLLIDGDSVVYKACSVVEYEFGWDDENRILRSNFKEAAEIVRGSITKLCDRMNTNMYRLCFSGPNNFRKLIDPNYKANRRDMRKPMCYQEVFDHFLKSPQGIMEPTLEADDLMGLFHCKNGTFTTICSPDKDMKTLKGWVFDGNEDVYIEEWEANLRFYRQVLTGDTADNYQGIRGVGPKTAEKIISSDMRDEVVMWDAVVAAFNKHGLQLKDAIRTARLAYILRKPEDYNWETQEVNLWQPPT